MREERPMKEYGDIPKGAGFVVRVHRDQFRGKECIHVRTWYEFRPRDPDSLRPSSKGATVRVRDIPALMAALKRAEADCLSRGLLSLEDYTGTDLEPPATEAKP